LIQLIPSAPDRLAHGTCDTASHPTVLMHALKQRNPKPTRVIATTAMASIDTTQ